MFIGTNSGSANTTGTNNLFIGTDSGLNNIIGSNNIFFGNSAGYNNIADSNMFIGNQSGITNSTGTGNIFFGYSSGYSNFTSNNNIFLGYYTGYNNIADNNIFIGNETGFANTTGTGNIFFGLFTGLSNNTSNNNIFFGNSSGQNNIADNNLFIGNDSGLTNTTGTNNLFIGFASGYYNDTSNGNIFIGNSSGIKNNGDNNLFIGPNSGFNNTTGRNNSFIGSMSGYCNTTGTYNAFFGYLTGQGNNGTNNIFIGTETTPSAAVSSTFNDRFAIYKSSPNGITSNTTAGCKILIGGDFNTGTVGIGTLYPDSFTAGGMGSYTTTKLVVVGKVLANSYTSFTGAHKINLDTSINPSNLTEGMIMSSTGIVNLIDINNTVPTVNVSAKTNDKAIYGVYCGSEIVSIPSEDNTSNITVTNYYVNSLGEGGILVCNITGEIQNGDYITTCPIAGYGCLQADDLMHSYTVAKCTETINWANIPENVLCPSDGKMYKSILAACTYHCG